MSKLSTKRTHRSERVGKGDDRGSLLTTADLVVLSLIAERPMHGYELVKEYERQEVEDWASVSRPHVYYALQKLAERKLIDHVDIADDARGKAVYQITKSGLETLSGALGAPSWSKSRTPSTFNTWLGLSIHAKQADRKRVIAARRAFLAGQIEKEKETLVAIASDTGRRARIASVMVGLCIDQFEAELRWLDRALDAFT